MELPAEFVKSLDALPGIDPGELVAALGQEPPVSLRFNPFKVGSQPEGERVPWCRYGYYIDQRPSFTLDPLFHAGAYYVQEASSMFIEHVWRSVPGLGEGGGRSRVLDLCAAPGGKTTLLSTLAGLDSLVVANEVVRQRASTLADNVRKWGLGNVAVTNNDPSHFAGFRDWFDLVLVDAPCSGEGMFRKSPEAMAQWSPENVKLSASRQRWILSQVWDALKPGGILIYSTCTFNTVENEENVAWLMESYDCEAVEVEVPAEWAVVKSANTFRFYPHRVRGEGFFCAVVRKSERKARVKTPPPRRSPLADLTRQGAASLAPWVAQPGSMHFAQVGDMCYGYYAQAYNHLRVLAETLTVIYSGVQMGQLFGGQLRPDHALAMFHDLDRERVCESALPPDVARDYLRKRDVDPELFAQGLNLVSCEGFALGWAKRIGARVNNMYPKELRIMNL